MTKRVQPVAALAPTAPTVAAPFNAAGELEKALRRLVTAAPVDIVGANGLTIEGLKEYVEARAAARDLLDLVAFGR